MILIVGTGRSGTLTWTHYLRAQGLQVRHEPHSDRLLDLAGWAMRGHDPIIDLAGLGWVDVSAHHLFACVWDAMERLFSPQWLWPQRDPYTTVASMVGKGWYGKNGGGWSRRPTAADADEMSLSDWTGLPQVAKCAWWVGWATRQLHMLPAFRTVVVGLADDPAWAIRQLGYDRPVSRLPLNVSTHRSLTPEERRWVTRLAH